MGMRLFVLGLKISVADASENLLLMLEMGVEFLHKFIEKLVQSICERRSDLSEHRVDQSVKMRDGHLRIVLVSGTDVIREKGDIAAVQRLKVRGILRICENIRYFHK